MSTLPKLKVKQRLRTNDPYKDPLSLYNKNPRVTN